MPKDPPAPRKSDRTRAAILSAAREQFAAHGYEGATIRGIAERAGIDPAMVIRYFGSKDELFARATVFDLRLPSLDGVERSEIGATLVRHAVALWEGEAGGGSLPILLRSAASNDYAADKVREVFAAQVMPALARLSGSADAPRRAGLVASQILGLALTRYVLRLPPVVALSPEEIVALVGPTIQRYAAEPLK